MTSCARRSATSSATPAPTWPRGVAALLSIGFRRHKGVGHQKDAILAESGHLPLKGASSVPGFTKS